VCGTACGQWRARVGTRAAGRQARRPAISLGQFLESAYLAVHFDGAGGASDGYYWAGRRRLLARNAGVRRHTHTLSHAHTPKNPHHPHRP
jgi:hypothetical protein